MCISSTWECFSLKSSSGSGGNINSIKRRYSRYQMVVLGQWPYQHTITLDQLKRQAKVVSYYFVDSDTIISEKEAIGLKSKGYILNEKYLTVMSEDMSMQMSSYEKQSFPPVPDISISKKLHQNRNTSFDQEIDKVKESAAVLVVNNQEKEVMDDIGAIYNTHLDLWVINTPHLKLLRQKRREKYSGKVQLIQHGDGLTVEIRGDVTPHVRLLQSVGGVYNEEKDVWFVPMASIHKVYHIAK